MQRAVSFSCIALLASLSLFGMAKAALADCAPSIGLPKAELHAPDHDDFPQGNNLARPAGKALAATGQPLRVHGRVLDSACKPVVGAIVELWQANTDGIYQIADRAALTNPYAVFAGAGRTQTDNTGSFDFYTIFPGATMEASGPRSPHLHVRVRHEHTKTLTTELFFEDEQRNATDPNYSALSEATREPLTLRMYTYATGLIGETTLVLDGAVPYRQY